MIPDPSEEDLTLIRRYWPALPDELISPERARMARERNAEASEAVNRSESARQEHEPAWVKGTPGPITLDDIMESSRMQKPRPISDKNGNAFAIALLALLAAVACCCGGTAVGALWAVTG